MAVAAFLAGAFLTAALGATFLVVAFAAVTLPAAVFFAAGLAVPAAFFGFVPPNAVSQPVAYCELEPTRVIVMSFPFEYRSKKAACENLASQCSLKQVRFWFVNSLFRELEQDWVPDVTDAARVSSDAGRIRHEVDRQ